MLRLLSNNDRQRMPWQHYRLIVDFSGDGDGLLVAPNWTKLTIYVSSNRYSAGHLFLVCRGVPALEPDCISIEGQLMPPGISSYGTLGSECRRSELCQYGI